MKSTIQISAEVEVMECVNCGVEFGMTSTYITARRRDHCTFYCPNGHGQSYQGESDLERAERLRREEVERRKQVEAREVHLRDQLDAERRSKAAIQGHLTRARNRIANGVCPVAGCRRHFDNVQAHMQTMHPDYKLEEQQA